MDRIRHLGDARRVGHGRTCKRRWAALAVACWFPLGCLAPSPPPAGQHVLAGRELTGVYLSPSERDDVPSHLLVTSPAQGKASGAIPLPVSDLYAVPLAASSGAVSGQPALLVAGFLGDSSAPINSTMPTDSLGRLVVVQVPPTSGLPIPYNVLRVDVGAGTQEPLAHGSASGGLSSAGAFRLSPARTEVCVDAASALFALDGGSRPLAVPCSYPTFVGEDLYYVYAATRPLGTVCGTERGICRLGADGTSGLVWASTSISSLRALASNGAGKLLIAMSPNSGGSDYLLLDGETRALAPLPPETQGGRLGTVSPDTRWLGFVSQVDQGGGSAQSWFLFDWTTGARVAAAVNLLGQIAGESVWRPGHDEYWLDDPFADQFAVVKLEGSATTGAADVRYYPGPFPDAFLPDGNYWYYFYGNEAFVASADRPDAPHLSICQKSAVPDAPVQIADGRLLVQSQAIVDNRLPKDIAIVDPDTGGRRAVCSGCKLVALGESRALLLLDWAVAEQTGSLALVDFVSLARTPLAESVYAVAVDRGTSADVPAGTDALAPGIQVAFLVRNRLRAPYDGLWLVRLP
jgi:hypothetical protein